MGTFVYISGNHICYMGLPMVYGLWLLIGNTFLIGIIHKVVNWWSFVGILWVEVGIYNGFMVKYMGEVGIYQDILI